MAVGTYYGISISRSSLCISIINTSWIIWAISEYILATWNYSCLVDEKVFCLGAPSIEVLFLIESIFFNEYITIK